MFFLKMQLFSDFHVFATVYGEIEQNIAMKYHHNGEIVSTKKNVCSQMSGNDGWMC